jgi:hypothetical protein
MQAEQLGALVSARHWGQAAKFLAGRYDDERQDLLPVLEKCAHYLGFSQRWRLLKLSAPSKSKNGMHWKRRLDFFILLALMMRSLVTRRWQKLLLRGGNQSGRARWHSALQDVRYGAKPTARELLSVMCRDHPQNRNLRLQAQDPDIVGRL